MKIVLSILLGLLANALVLLNIASRSGQFVVLGVGILLGIVGATLSIKRLMKEKRSVSCLISLVLFVGAVVLGAIVLVQTI